MLRIVGLQILVTLLISLISLSVSGTAAAVSALLGGSACAVPNGLFALRLIAASKRSSDAAVAAFFVGEFLKLALTIALLALVIWRYHDLVWPALMIAVIAVLKSYLIVLALPARMQS